MLCAPVNTVIDRYPTLSPSQSADCFQKSSCQDGGTCPFPCGVSGEFWILEANSGLDMVGRNVWKINPCMWMSRHCCPGEGGSGQVSQGIHHTRVQEKVLGRCNRLRSCMMAYCHMVLFKQVSSAPAFSCWSTNRYPGLQGIRYKSGCRVDASCSEDVGITTGLLSLLHLVLIRPLNVVKHSKTKTAAEVCTTVPDAGC